MKLLIVLLSLVTLALAALPPAGTYTKQGELLIMKEEGVEHVYSPRPQDYLSADDVPANWDWRWVNGTQFTPFIRNQHNPGLSVDNYCGSCWAVSSANMLQTRWKILHHQSGKYAPDIQISIQDVINCANAGGCGGGNAYGVLEYGKNPGFVDETCNSYLGRDETCQSTYIGARCYTCNRQWTPHCQAVPNYMKYMVDEIGNVSGEEDMMKEIYSRGPIVASIHDPPSLKAWAANATHPIYQDPSGSTMATHNVAIVGYGVEDDGTKFWVIMNSWGTSWNSYDGGFFKLIRGINNLGIEGNGCLWGTMKPEIGE